MFALRQPALKALLAIHFAIVGCGSVVLHQLAGDSDCQCLNHGRTAEFGDLQGNESIADCDCVEHLDSGIEETGILPSFTSDQSQLDDHACPLCQFFEQRMPVASDLDLVITAQRIELAVTASSASYVSNLLGIHTARGPPAVL